MLTVKHSKEALAFWTIFKAMKPGVKKEVRDMIAYEKALGDNSEIISDMMTAFSLDSFQEIWDAPKMNIGMISLKNAFNV